jgi:hypothetical protein
MATVGDHAGSRRAVDLEVDLGKCAAQSGEGVPGTHRVLDILEPHRSGSCATGAAPGPARRGRRCASAPRTATRPGRTRGPWGRRMPEIRCRRWTGNTAGRLAGGGQRGRRRSRGGRIAPAPARCARAPGRPHQRELGGGSHRRSSRLQWSARCRAGLGPPVVLRGVSPRDLRIRGPGSYPSGSAGTGQTASMAVRGSACKRRRTCSGTRRGSAIGPTGRPERR